MDSNTHSVGAPAGLAALVAELQGLADQDPDRLADGALAERVMTLRGLMDRLQGHWLGELAAVDARGAAGADHGVQAGATAAWLRNRLRMGAGTAAGLVRTARALDRGPLAATAQALAAGELSPAHAQVLAAGTRDLPDPVAAEAEPVLVAAARRLDPPRLRRVLAHLRGSPTPTAAGAQAQRRHRQPGLWLASTWEGMVAVNGLLEPEAGQTLLAALEPLARPADSQDPAAVANAGPMPWSSWPAAAWRAAGCPRLVGAAPAAGDRRPGQPPRPPPRPGRRRWWGGAAGARGVPAAGLRRGGHPGAGHPPPHQPEWRWRAGGAAAGGAGVVAPGPWGAPTQPLEVGRTSRVVTAAQRAALAIRDGGCVFPGCDRPPAWCEAHHLVHWLHGGPTDLANLALLCRAHHRAVHEGGWRLARDPDGRLAATPPHRRPQPAPAAA
jgi:hypothetical protein